MLADRNRSTDASRHVCEAGVTRVESIRVERHRDWEANGHRSERGARGDTDLAHSASVIARDVDVHATVDGDEGIDRRHRD